MCTSTVNIKHHLSSTRTHTHTHGSFDSCCVHIRIHLSVFDGVCVCERMRACVVLNIVNSSGLVFFPLLPLFSLRSLRTIVEASGKRRPEREATTRDLRLQFTNE